MLNIVILSLTMIYISVATSYTSYSRNLSTKLQLAMNTPPYKQGSLRYHTYASAAGLAKRRIPKLTRMTMVD